MEEPPEGSASGAGDRPPRRGPPSIPARLLGTGARGAARAAQVTGLDEAIETAAEEAIVRAVESQAFEHTLDRVLQGPAIEEAVARALDSPAVERALVNALDSRAIERFWDQLLASDEAQKLVERIAEAPEVRNAIAAQSVGFIGDIGRGLKRAGRRLDAAFERTVRNLLRRPSRAEPTDRAGAITRLIAFLLDAALVNGAFLGISALVAFIADKLSGGNGGAPTQAIVLGAGLWIILGLLYLVLFWGLAGETPGMRFLGIHLDRPSGIGLRRAFKRLIGTLLAALPLLLGFKGVVLRDDRRGWPDRFAGTEVMYVGTAPPPAPWSELDPARTQSA